MVDFKSSHKERTKARKPINLNGLDGKKGRGPSIHQMRFDLDADLMDYALGYDTFGWIGALRSGIRTLIHRRVITHMYRKFIGRRNEIGNASNGEEA